MTHWHEVLPTRFGVVERFNHGWPAKTARRGERTLEFGSGLGEHLSSEPDFARENYVASELRQEMADVIKERHPEVEVIAADCRSAHVRGRSFDRVIAINVLEHLPNLPRRSRRLAVCAPRWSVRRRHPVRGGPGLLTRAPESAPSGCSRSATRCRTTGPSRVSISTCRTRSCRVRPPLQAHVPSDFPLKVPITTSIWRSALVHALPPWARWPRAGGSALAGVS